MKVAVVFVLLFATVLCRPVSHFIVRRPAPPALRKQALVAPQAPAAPVQSFTTFNNSFFCFLQAAVEEAPTEVSSDSTASNSDTASVSSKTSEDSDDDDDDEAEESEEEEESSNSSESGESSTAAPATIIPVIVTDEPLLETTAEPIEPTIVTDPARGDNLGGYPSDYKSIVYVEDKSYHKVPVPYKSYEFVGAGKKMAYDMTDGNEVEKSLKVYKALQVHSDLLEEDTSTPEVESQGLDTSSGTSQDISPRQAALPEEEESASTSESTTSESESSSTPEEEEEEEESASTASDSASTSQESEDEESQSSEEATATPGAADSDSDESDSAESDSDEEAAAATDATTDMPAVITAK
uniref:LisH domain-containing protein C1711.05-like n=1 Tax=Stegastes partitus TaxID=144197 RepID=A0A3B4Z9C0_9TELE